MPKTLFATHYHELNELAERFERIKNYHISTHESGHKVVFLRKLEPGGSEHSFGIHVAKMAGMPFSIIKRASQLLHQLEQKSITNGQSKKELVKDTLAKIPNHDLQLNIFEQSDPVAARIKEDLMHVNVNSMTPIECMLKLNELKALLDEVLQS